MLEFILQLIITPVVLLAAARSMSGVTLKDNNAAIWTSVWIIIAGFLIGWLLTFILNLATLGILWLIGLGIITRTIAYAIIIELVDQFRGDFHTKGFMPSLWLAIILAIAWGLIDWMV